MHVLGNLRRLNSFVPFMLPCKSPLDSSMVHGSLGFRPLKIFVFKGGVGGVVSSFSDYCENLSSHSLLIDGAVAPQWHLIQCLTADYTIVDTCRHLVPACWVNSVHWKCVKESRHVESWRCWSILLCLGRMTKFPGHWTLLPRGMCHESRVLLEVLLREHTEGLILPQDKASVWPTLTCGAEGRTSDLEREPHRRWDAYAQDSLRAPGWHASDEPGKNSLQGSHGFGDRGCLWPQGLCAGGEGTWCWLPESSRLGRLTEDMFGVSGQSSLLALQRYRHSDALLSNTSYAHEFFPEQWHA